MLFLNLILILISNFLFLIFYRVLISDILILISHFILLIYIS